MSQSRNNAKDPTDSASGDETVATPTFGTSLATFAFSPAPRKPSNNPADTGRFKRRGLEQLGSDEVQSKVGITRGTPGPSPRKKKRVRGYAEPEAYSHLQGLPDILVEGLDVVFCGINPGEKSAEIGHHYGHHSNHFWDCLYQSGFTPTKLPPEEDITLPDRFSLGLTNLVERPTAEQNELSSDEQAASVPALLAKIAQYRPRILCFLGLGIANTFQRQLTLSMGVSRIKNSALGLQSYKMVHQSANDGLEILGISETIFYALPSPSARVVKPQKVGKIGLFTNLKETLNQVKRRDLTTEELATIIRVPDDDAVH